jgi:hypothetical protein
MLESETGTAGFSFIYKGFLERNYTVELSGFSNPYSFNLWLLMAFEI